MSALFSQFFQRGRGTAPHLRPRPPAPFETGSPLTEIETDPVGQDLQIDYRMPAPTQTSDKANSQGAAAFIGDSEPTLAAVPPTATGAYSDDIAQPALANVLDTPVSAAAPFGNHLNSGHATDFPLRDENTPAAVTNQIDVSPALAQPRRRGVAPTAPIAGNVANLSMAAQDSDGRVALAATPATIGSSPNPKRAGMIDGVNAPMALAQPAAPAAILQTQDAQMPFVPTAVASMASNAAAPGTAGQVASQTIVPVTAGQRVTLSAAAPPERNSAAPLSGQTASSTHDAPRVEVRIGRINIQVPPVPREPDQRSSAIGMSLDAFIAETRQ